MKYTIENTEINLVLGDITESEVDVIVSAESYLLRMEHGVSKAIRERGGDEIQLEASKYAPVPVGDAILTSAGRLKAEYVIHAVTMDGDCTTDIIKIRECTENSLIVADKQKCTSIAFSSLGTGKGDFPPDLSAQTMLTAIFKHLWQHSDTNLKQIVVYLHHQYIFDIFEAELNKLRR